MMGTGPVPRSTEQGTPHLRRTVDAGHTRSSSEPLRRVRKADALRARNDELAGQLRAAALEGDEAHLRQLLSELLHIRGLTRAQRISLQLDRKSTRLNSSHSQISYAVFCLKKKTKTVYNLLDPVH